MVIGALCLLGALCLAFCLLWAPAAHAAAPTPAEARARAGKALGDEFQTRLPEEDKPAAASDAPPPRPERNRDRSVGAATAGSAVANVLMYVLAGVAVVLLVLFLVSELGGYQKNVAGGAGAGAAGTESDAETAAVAERPLDDAEALARAGRFGAAIHVLLLRTLEELMRKLDRPLPRSKTSREILHEVRLPDEARGALSHLVSAVEVSFFGGAEPGAEDYQVCVERFRRFADAYTRAVRA